MTIHWSFDPVLVTFGPFTIHWYGVLFVGAFLAAQRILRGIFKAEGVNPDYAERLFYYAVVGAIVGARLVHCFLYDPEYYLSNPWSILRVWEGGLASHGGMIGVLIGLWFGSRSLRSEMPLLWLIDRASLPAALGSAFVRIGNFVNSEILGKPTYSDWGVVFQSVDAMPRYPVQLYEAVAYLLTFLVLLGCYKKFKHSTPHGLLFGVFLTLVFSARLVLEFLKEPQAAYEAYQLFSTGQYLSLPMVLIGGMLTWWSIACIARDDKKMAGSAQA
ncbi:prolipoprotein diacylglyceryl transferase [Pseudomonas juntendi]|uniref:prolipoprotein diacylglyceryl transferase n=1 Tax=Pseudomonas juntendi TaxID=2666183 RepID=UPI003209F634